MKNPGNFPKKIKIGNRLVGENQPVLIIADIGANFDGNLEKAKKLALAVKEAGGDVVKIQSFLAPKIVSGSGFFDSNSGMPRFPSKPLFFGIFSIAKLYQN